MKSEDQSIITEFRNHPRYPTIMTRVIGGYHLVYGFVGAMIAYTILVDADLFANILTYLQLSTDTNILLINVPPDQVDTVRSAWRTFFHAIGMIWGITGALALIVGLGVLNHRNGVYRLTIILNAWFLFNWVLGESFLLILLVPFAATTLLVFVRDNKVKVLFGRARKSVQNRPSRYPLLH